MKTRELTSASFDDVVSGSAAPVLVDFWAPWCGPCLQLGPVIDQVAEETADQAVVAKVNVDEARDLAVRYNIRSIPTLLVFRGGEVVERLQGVQPKERIAAALSA
ncbi:thioredoxin [Haloferula helveola]|uniref:Thioredoxin n=1 Tax=Haloferula helveola TaxID=490095 RepID=A0ABN6H3K7_9BACT|nr:thioredoxin [Haloferula helveola]